MSSMLRRIGLALLLAALLIPFTLSVAQRTAIQLWAHWACGRAAAL